MRGRRIVESCSVIVSLLGRVGQGHAHFRDTVRSKMDARLGMIERTNSSMGTRMATWNKSDTLDQRIVERERYTVDAGTSNCETGAHYEPEITGPALLPLFPSSRSIESESP